MNETRQQSIQHLWVLFSALSVHTVGGSIDFGTEVELIGEDEVFECFGVRVGGEIVGEVGDVGFVVSCTGQGVGVVRSVCNEEKGRWRCCTYLSSPRWSKKLSELMGSGLGIAGFKYTVCVSYAFSIRSPEAPKA